MASVKSVLVFLSLFLFCRVTWGCTPWCPCCYEEEGSISYVNCNTPVSDLECSFDMTQCEQCSCCSTTTIGGGLVATVETYRCVDNPPTGCIAGVSVSECLTQNCKCCNMDNNPPVLAPYLCTGTPPQNCVTDDDSIAGCLCSCWVCETNEDVLPTVLYYDCGTQPPNDRCLQQQEGSVPMPSTCLGPDAADGVNKEAQLVGLLSIPVNAAADCTTKSIGTIFSATNGGVAMTAFNILVTDIGNGVDCRFKAASVENPNMDFNLDIHDFSIGASDDLFKPSCGCYEADGSRHGSISEIKIECIADVYFDGGVCPDITTICDTADDCDECNKMGCCWHSDCTCKNYCSVVHPFAIPYCVNDPADSCCPSTPTGDGTECGSHNGDCKGCEAAKCCYHTDCSCMPVCLAGGFIWALAPGQCDIADPQKYCCEDELCGIYHQGETVKEYVKSDSVRVEVTDLTVSADGHLVNSLDKFTCLSQNCDDHCEPSVSLDVGADGEISHATLECVCCDCDGSASEPECCKEADFYPKSPCLNHVPKPCDSITEHIENFEECYCCDLGKLDKAAGGCVCHTNCICGGPQFDGGCHPDYIRCCYDDKVDPAEENVKAILAAVEPDCVKCSEESCEDLSLKPNGTVLATTCANANMVDFDLLCIDGIHKDFVDSRAICQTHHMRLCTRDESMAGVGETAGCGIDDQMHWTQTACLHGGGSVGHFVSDGTASFCANDNLKTYGTLCCADPRESVHCCRDKVPTHCTATTGYYDGKYDTVNPINSFEDCCALCESTPGCIHFSYKWASGFFCRLYNAIDKDGVLTTAGSWKSDYFECFPQVVGKHGDVNPPDHVRIQTDMWGCCQECLRRADCVHYTFVIHPAAALLEPCYLYSSTDGSITINGNYRSDAFDDSGVPHNYANVMYAATLEGGAGNVGEVGGTAELNIAIEQEAGYIGNDDADLDPEAGYIGNGDADLDPED